MSAPRSIPPPIRNLTLRNRLCELLGEALRDRARAAPLCVLVALGRVARGRDGRVGVSRGALIEAAERLFQEFQISDSAAAVLDELLADGLVQQGLAGDRELRISPGIDLAPEFRAADLRLSAYRQALEALFRLASRSAGGEVEQALEQAACLFNEGLFFEVHEVLEAVWLKQDGQARRFLQGLIQIAVGFHHLENKNLNGALSLLREGWEKARLYGPEHFGLRLDRFLEEADACRRSIQSLGTEAFDRFDRRMIPRMEMLGWTTD
jgi:hypothetical protein